MRPCDRRPLLFSVFALLLTAGQAIAIAPQDHEKCYKIKDPLKLSANVDLISPEFGTEAGCLVSKAKYFCTPATKVVNTAVDKTTGSAITLLDVYAAAAPGDRICYKLKCPGVAIGAVDVTDQFGARAITASSASYVCTPAVQGSAYCGDGVIDPGEDCDGAALGACTVGCRADCSCQCETTCCYVENLGAPPDAECFQYSGNPSQVAAFASQCVNGLAPPMLAVPASLPAGSMANSSLAAGPCAASPLFATQCVAGPPGFGNLHVVPSDSTCP